MGGRSGELCLVKAFVLPAPPPLAPFPPPFAALWDTIGTQYPEQKTATSEEKGVALRLVLPQSMHIHVASLRLDHS
jgi:hypothetical protein